MVVIVMGGIGKDAIIDATINHHHSQWCHHWHCQLNPIAAAINNDCYCCRQQLLLPLPHSQQQWLPEASGCCLSLTVAMAVIVNGSGRWWQPRQWWSSSTAVVVDGGGKDAIAATAINCHFHQQWLLLPLLTAAIATAAQATGNGGGSLHWRQ
jgi:hypothetical protein